MMENERTVETPVSNSSKPAKKKETSTLIRSALWRIE